MRKARATMLVVGIAVVGFAGCGGGGSTTVINKTAPSPVAQTVTTTTTAAAQAPTTTTTATAQAEQSAPQGTTTTADSPAAPPKVTGLTLPEAKKELSAAGFKADVSNTDTVFGIVVPQNYTVCKQSAPRGSIVPILAQKYGC